MQQLEAARHRVVEREAALVAIVRLKMRARQTAGEPTERVAAFRPLDLNHVGPELGQQHRRVRGGDEGSEIEHREPGQELHPRSTPA